MNLLEESLRIKKMMVIEQSSSDNYFKEFSRQKYQKILITYYKFLVSRNFYF